MLVQLSKIPSLVTSRDSSLSPVFLLSRLTCRFVSALKIQRAPGGERAVVRALDDAVLNARRIAISSLLFIRVVARSGGSHLAHTFASRFLSATVRFRDALTV